MRSMAAALIIMVGVVLYSCGAKEEKGADVYQSCSFTTGTDKNLCIEAKNATSLKETCGKLAGSTYAQTQCTVTAGTKGCSYKNGNLVELTDWYTGSAWTADEISSECAKLTSGTVVTK